MNGLETIWDIKERGGQSTVQKLGDTCTKLYPVSTNPIISRGHITLDQLRVYHDFQSKLKSKVVSIEWNNDHYHCELKNLGYNEIHVSFLDLGKVDIREASNLHTRGKLLITEVPFIEGISPINLMYGFAIKTLISRAYVNDGLEKSALSMQNLKIISNKDGIIQIVCTDAFWNIPQMVDALLSL